MAHTQKPDFVFRRNGRVRLNRRGLQSTTGSRGVRISGSNAGYTTFRGSVEVWRVLATHSIRQFPHHFPYRASPCAVTFQLDSTNEFLAYLGGRRIIKKKMGLLACRDCGFESRRGHGCLSLSRKCCMLLEISATGRSLVQKSPSERGVSEWSRILDNMEAMAHWGCRAMKKN
jgi:hypothetical protein